MSSDMGRGRPGQDDLSTSQSSDGQASSSVQEHTAHRAPWPGLTQEQADICEGWLADAAQVDRELLAYVAVVATPAGSYRRRTFLTLAAALAAVEKAHARGVDASVCLCELRRIGGAR